MSASHTPGPWSIKGPSRPAVDNPEGGDYAVITSGGQIIAETFRRSSEAHTHPAEANARLISASPRLLAALRKLDSIERGMQGWHEDARAEAWAEARAAIAEATGGEQ